MAKEKRGSCVGEAELKSHLKIGVLKPVYFLYGEDTWLSSRYTERLVKLALGDSDLADFNLTRLDGLSCEPRDIIGAAETLPVMADRRCVVVRNWNVEKAYRDVTAFKKDFLPFLESPPETCVLIFRLTGRPADYLSKEDRYKTTSAKWSTFTEAVARVGMVAELAPRSENENARALSALAQKAGCSLDPSVARLLISRVGNDLARLINETNKLCALADGGVITAEMVKSATAESLEARIYDLSKAIAAGRAQQIYSILQALAFQREEPLAVLGALSGAFVDFYRVRVALDAALPARSVVTAFHYEKRAFAIDQAVPIVRYRSTACLRGCLARLAQTDRLLKSSSVDPWPQLERLSLELMGDMQKGVKG